MAAYIKWTEEYSVGVQQLDDEHKKLFSLINDYYEAIVQKRAKQATMKILRGLEEYTEFHFGDEEKLMLESGYAGYPEQKKQHTLFIEKVRDYMQRLDEGKLLLSVEITNFLKDWLANHIKIEDKQYGPALNEKGIR